MSKATRTVINLSPEKILARLLVNRAALVEIIKLMGIQDEIAQNLKESDHYIFEIGEQLGLKVSPRRMNRHVTNATIEFISHLNDS